MFCNHSETVIQNNEWKITKIFQMFGNWAEYY